VVAEPHAVVAEPHASRRGANVLEKEGSCSTR
jgi:hypothetical protein